MHSGGKRWCLAVRKALTEPEPFSSLCIQMDHKMLFMCNDTPVISHKMNLEHKVT